MQPQDYSYHTVNTPEHICNMAVGYIGRFVTSIANLGTEASTNETARACLNYFDITRRSFLQSYSWGFATKENLLQKYVATPKDTISLKNTYIRPADLIQILAVGSKGCTCTCLCACAPVQNEGFELLEDKIIPCNGHWIRYIYNHTQLEMWSPLALRALALALAVEVAGSITMDSTFTNSAALSEAAAAALIKARQADAYGKPMKINYESTVSINYPLFFPDRAKSIVNSRWW